MSELYRIVFEAPPHVERRRVAQPAALLALAVLVGCASGSKSPPVPDAKSPPLAECSRLAKEIESSVNANEPSKFRENFDVEAILQTAMAVDGVPESARDGFKRGASESFTLAEGICEGIGPSGHYTLLRIRNEEGKPRALFRLVRGDGGLNYHEMLFRTSRQGEAKIADVYMYSSGEWFTETLRRSFLLLSAEANRGFLSRLFGRESDYVKNLRRIQTMQEHARSGSFKQALDTWQRLPPSLQKNKMMLILRMVCAMKVGEAEYAAAIADLEKHFPNDPALDLLLIDGQFMRKDFDGALSTIDRLEERVGGDPYLNVVRGNIQLASERLADAKNMARKAIHDEPTLREAYWLMVLVSLRERDFAETARSLSTIETKFGLEIGDLRDSPEYAEFVKSRAYADWPRSREE